MDLKSLRSALEPLTKFGSEELTFEVEGTSVTLRPLLPKEEIACQQFAASVLVQAQDDEGLGDDDPLTRTAALRYMDQFRIEVISYAIVQIGDTDLRKTDHIATGETLENGTAVKVPRHVALRGIMTESWSRGMITITFSKYGDLVSKVAEKADKVAEASVSDLDAEIERQEKRLETLREERTKRAAGDPGVTYDQIRGLVSAGEALNREVSEAVDIAQADREAADAIRAGAAQAPPAPEAAQAPEAPPAPQAPQAPPAPQAAVQTTQPRPPAPPPMVRQPVTPPVVPPPSPKVKGPEGFVSSFADPDEDPHALDAEAERILAARRQAASMAREGLGDPLAHAKQVGSVAGPKGEQIPTFQLPSETISGRGRKSKEAPPPNPDLDPDPREGSSLNPNFKPPGR